MNKKMKPFYIMCFKYNYSIVISQMSNQVFSIYLPYVLPQFEAPFITNVFENKHNIGKVSRVDIVSKHQSHNSAYVRFEYINNQFAHVRRFIERISNGENVTLTYQGRFYWKILRDTSKGKNFSTNERKNCIDIDIDIDTVKEECSMKDNKFFSNLVKSKTIEKIKKNDTIVVNIPFFSNQDYKNMEEIDTALEEEHYMQLFMEEIERFDEGYFCSLIH